MWFEILRLWLRRFHAASIHTSSIEERRLIVCLQTEKRLIVVVYKTEEVAWTSRWSTRGYVCRERECNCELYMI